VSNANREGDFINAQVFVIFASYDLDCLSYTQR
jgi:hypothetical protein